MPVATLDIFNDTEVSEHINRLYDEIRTIQRISKKRRFTTQNKYNNVQASVIDGFKKTGRQLRGRPLVEICSHQFDHPHSRHAQFKKQLGSHKYVGCDLDYDVIAENNIRLPHLTWHQGNVANIINRYPNAALINLDFCKMRGVFWAKNINVKEYRGSQAEAERFIASNPGDLPLVLSRAADDAVVFVNVVTKHRAHNYTDDLPVFVAALENTLGWVVAPVMPGDEKFYTYRSQAKDSGGAQGAPSYFTTFCLVKSAK